MLETGMSDWVAIRPIWPKLTVERHCAHSPRAHIRGCPVRCYQSDLKHRLYFANIQPRAHQEAP